MYYNNYYYNFLDFLKYAFKAKGIFDIILNFNNQQKVLQTFAIGAGIDIGISCIQQQAWNGYYRYMYWAYDTTFLINTI